MSTETPLHHDESLKKPPKVSRRDFLLKKALPFGIGGAAAVSYAGYSFGEAVFRAISTIDSPSSPATPSTNAEHVDDHVEHPLADWVDDESASFVVANFGLHVGLSALDIKDLGLTSIVGVGVPEGMRLLALEKVAPERAHHETESIKGTLTIIPALVAAVDIGSSAEAAVTALLTEDLPKHRLTPAEVKARQDTMIGYNTLDHIKQMSENELRDYVELTRQEIITLVAKNAGLASVLSGLSATLGTSAATESFEPIAKALTRFNYAKSQLVTGQTSESDAASHAEKAISGDMGLANLVVATAANINGFWWGSPPDLQSALTEDIQTHAVLTGESFVTSQVLNIAMYAIWLAKEGVLDATNAGVFKDFVSQYATSQIESIRQIKQDFSDPERRDMMGGGYGATRALAAKLESIGKHHDPARRQVGDLQKELHSIPQPLIEFSVADYLDSKIEAAARIINNFRSRETEVSKQVEQIFAAHQNGTDGQIVDQQIYDSISILVDSDPQSKVEVLKHVRERTREHSGNRLTGYLLDVIQTDPHNQGQIVEIAARGADVLESVSGTRINEQKLLSEAEKDLNGGDNNVGKLDEILEKIGIKELTHVVDNVFRIYRGSEPVGEHRPILSHPAQDAAKALLTQLPALDALVRKIVRLLPTISGVRPGEQPTKEQARLQFIQTMIAGGAISMVGDNVLSKLTMNRTLPQIIEPFIRGVNPSTRDGAEFFTKEAALMISKVYGAATKIGSVNNFLVDKVVVDVNGNNQIQVRRRRIEMGESIRNPWAYIQIAAVTGFFAKRTSDMFDSLTD